MHRHDRRAHNRAMEHVLTVAIALLGIFDIACLCGFVISIGAYCVLKFL